jgi:hypothetical protein
MDQIQCGLWNTSGLLHLYEQDIEGRRECHELMTFSLFLQGDLHLHLWWNFLVFMSSFGSWEPTIGPYPSKMYSRDFWSKVGIPLFLRFPHYFLAVFLLSYLILTHCLALTCDCSMCLSFKKWPNRLEFKQSPEPALLITVMCTLCLYLW